MGNEESRHPKLEIEEEAVETADSWTLHYAKDEENNVFVHSAFISQPKISEANVSLLKNLAKNLMIHRHPYIIKYMSSWTKSNRFYLLTEEVKPLSLTISNQSALQICVGLHSILTAIIFLHEKAMASHNNICCASIYVTPEGVWKLGGLEYLMKFSEVTPAYLKNTRAKRYEKGVPPEEDSILTNSKVNAEAIDRYSFGVLVEELLKKKNSDEVPSLLEFKDFCKKELQNSDPDKRISLSKVINHKFFNHSFIKISRFLCDLPLKTADEKKQFFSHLIDQLSLFPEEVVGCQLASLLLSRVVLLDQAAQAHLLPIILQPKIGESQKSGEGFFSEASFKKYLIPKLLRIFSVRDVQIRLILLHNFHLFCDMFSLEQLKQNILPELLLGIKDVNDDLVSTTLKVLSHLVMILGSSTVIGGKRAKLFADGRPKSLDSSSVTNQTKMQDKIRNNLVQCNSEIPFVQNGLPERPSPDGGEADAPSPTTAEVEGDTENWSDWDSGDKESSKVPEILPEQTSVPLENSIQNEKMAVNKILPDIDSLDIKNTSSSRGAGNDIDFFHDMEPVISKTQILSVKSSKTIFDVESDEIGSNWECWEGDWESEEGKNAFD